MIAIISIIATVIIILISFRCASSHCDEAIPHSGPKLLIGRSEKLGKIPKYVNPRLYHCRGNLDFRIYEVCRPVGLQMRHLLFAFLGELADAWLVCRFLAAACWVGMMLAVSVLVMVVCLVMFVQIVAGFCHVLLRRHGVNPFRLIFAH